jgi:hypothetical protein
MGMLTGGFYSSTAEVGGTPTLTNTTIGNTEVDPDNAYAAYKIDQDGKVYQSKTTSSTPNWEQINSANDWVRPVSEAPGLWEVRYTNVTGDSPYGTLTTTNEDVWHSLSTSDWEIWQRETSPVEPGTMQTNCDIELRYNGGSVLESCTLQLEAAVDYS